MRTLFILFALFAFIAKGYSQDVHFGALFGPTLSGSTVKYPTYEVKSPHPGAGFDIGVFAEIPLQKQLSFRPSLTYSLERASAVIEGDKAKVHVSFIKIPLDVIYHSTSMDNKLSFGIGPYIAYNLGGKYNWAETRTNSIAFGSDEDTDFGRTYKRVDVGLDLFAGYQFNKQILFSAKFDYGLLNMVHMTEDPDEAHLAKIHTLCFGVAVGYILGSK
ncbi:MAG: porin family protein [Chitinophagaceae bacterium]